MVLISSEDVGPSENVSPLEEFFALFHLRHNTPTLASVSVPIPQTANATAGVQVEHTEVKKHYNTLNGYCDHHESIPPHTHSLKKCVCVILHYSGKNFT